MEWGCFVVRRLKYLVLSRLRSGVSVTPAVVNAIADHYDLVKKLKANGKLSCQQFDVVYIKFSLVPSKAYPPHGECFSRFFHASHFS